MDSGFSTGEVLKQTFSTFFSHVVVFSLIAGIVLSPALVLQGISILSEADPLAFRRQVLVGLAGLLSVLLGPVATGALTFGVFQHVRGRPFTAGACIAVGFRRLLPVLAVSIIVGLIAVVGLVLCIVPGVLALCVFAAAVPAAVIERPGVFGAIHRSEELTRGDRWHVFGVLAVLWVLQIMANMVGGGLSVVAPLAFLLYSVVVTVVATGLNATAGALIYYHLRRTKESIDVDEIAAVFD